MLMQKKSSIKGEWAKAGQDVFDGDIVVVLDAGTLDTTGEFGPRYVFALKTRNGEKNLGLNQTSINNLVDAFGQDSAGWVGQKAKAWVMKVMIGGGLKNVVYLSHPDAAMDDEGRFSSPAKKHDIESVELDPTDEPAF